MGRFDFPLMLAGPIVRRAELTRAWIWLATSRKCIIDASFYKITQLNEDEDEAFDYQSMETVCEPITVRVGRRLFIHLIKISPLKGPFPTDNLIGYNLQFSRGSEQQDLNSLGCLTPDHP